MDLMAPPPENYLGAERREMVPGNSWYYHLGAPDPWVIVLVYAHAPYEVSTGTYYISAEFRLIGSRATTQWRSPQIVDVESGLAELALEIEARVTEAKRELERGLEAIRNPPPDPRDFWTRLAG